MIDQLYPELLCIKLYLISKLPESLLDLLDLSHLGLQGRLHRVHHLHHGHHMMLICNSIVMLLVDK